MLPNESQTDTYSKHYPADPSFVAASGVATKDLGEAGLPREPAWRRIDAIEPSWPGTAPILASRWIDSNSGRRQVQADAPAGRHVVSIALRRTRLRLSIGGREVFDGAMPEGSVHVTCPPARQAAIFDAPCDFVHLYVSDSWMRGQGKLSQAFTHADQPDSRSTVLRDPVSGQLARTLVESAHAFGPAYVESVARTVLLRVAALHARGTEAGTLPKWRLRRVQEHLNANLDESITLGDLARVAGLSRSYFAAQFRASTGYRPHEYVVSHRIDQSKRLLAETDMPIVQVAHAVGFQTQAHFSTVFKRLTGTTPARWRLAQLNPD